MLSRTLYRKQRGRRPLTALAIVSLVAGLVGLGTVAFASTPANLFELEGNAVSGTGDGGAAPDDWDRVCREVTGSSAACGTTSSTHGATAVSWTDDTAVVTPGCAGGTNCSIFTGGGSKDPIDVNQWAWKTDSGGLPDKDNLVHSFAARYSITSSTACPGVNGETAGATKCEMLFFGSDRFDNSGDAQQGFWFFQNKITLGTNAIGGGQGFTSSGGTEFHRNGDLLLISDFSNGGTTSTITAYKWDTTCKKAGRDPLAPGDCGDANLRVLSIAANANCVPADPALSGTCGIVNTTDGTVAPWSFTDKSGNTTYLAGEFYEGGVNLSQLNLGNECFASVMSETRSSTSTTAVLKDFVLGGFGNCTSGTVTTPQVQTATTPSATYADITSDANGNQVPDVSITTAGKVVVRDKAVVTVAGVQTFAGSVQFSLCGPIADLTSTANCKTGGIAIGSPVAANSPSPRTVNGPDTTLTSVGRYCWRANFTSTTSGVPASADPPATGTGSDSVTECFEVLPVQPTLTTTGGADVALGNAITDTATISGTANQPGSNGVGPGGTINATNGAADDGSISWTLNGPNTCTSAGLTISGTPAAVTGDGTYGPVSATPTAIGKYTWVASYTSGSVNTKNAGPSSCPPTQADGDEEVNVSGNAAFTSAQDWLPNDTVTLTGPVNLNGSLTFTLYNDGTCGTSGGTQQYTVTRTVTNAASGSTFSTSNTSVKATASSTWSWKVHYDDTTLNDPADSCSEVTSLTITN